MQAVANKPPSLRKLMTCALPAAGLKEVSSGPNPGVRSTEGAWFSTAADTVPDHLRRIDDLVEALPSIASDATAACFSVKFSSFALKAMAEALS